MKYWYKFIAIIGVILTSCENKSTTTVSFPQRIVVENFLKMNLFQNVEVFQ